MKIEAVGNQIRFVTVGGTREFEHMLSLEEARAVFLALGEAITNVEGGIGKPSAHLVDWPAFMSVRDPAMDMAVTPSGEAMLIALLSPLPPIQITFSDERARALAATLQQITTTPADMRHQKKQ